MGSYISGDVALVPFRFATFDQGAAGSTDLVAAVSGYKIRVLGYVVSLAAAGTAKFQSNASTDLTGAIPLAINVPLVFDGGLLAPAFQTAIGEKLNIVTATGAGKGHVCYVLVNV